MLLIANDIYGNRVYIENAQKHEQYFCPLCKENLVVRKGNKNCHHFAHKPHTKCIDTWSNDKTDWHINWQNRFPIDCQEVIKNYNGKKHIADVLLEKQKIVIEFQHSKLSRDEFKDRNSFYNSLGYKVIWVFDVISKYQKHRIKNSDDIHFEWHSAIETIWGFNANQDNVEIYFQIEDFPEEDEIINQYIENGKINYDRINYAGNEEYINDHINDQIILLKVIRNDEYFYEFIVSPKRYTLDDFMFLFYPQDNKHYYSILNNRKYNIKDLYDNLIYYKRTINTKYYFGCPISELNIAVNNTIDIDEETNDRIGICQYCQYSHYTFNGIRCNCKFRDIKLNDNDKILELNRNFFGMVKYLKIKQDGKIFIYKYKIIDTIFNLWKENITKMAIFYNVKSRVYVKIVDDPNKSIKKYLYVYGVFSMNKDKFNGKNESIQYPNKPEWVMILEE